MALLVLASALATVWAREANRHLDLGIREQRDRIRQLETEWGRLQLEQAALASRSRVERLARERFDMHVPRPDEIWDFRP
jgi:cell division protein FtsL